MQGYQLTFYTQQDIRHGQLGLGQWLVEEAKRLGLRGATLITAAEGFGKDRRLHAAHFFELADQPVEVTMVVTADEADRFFARLAQEKIEVFFVKAPIEFGTTGA